MSLMFWAALAVSVASPLVPQQPGELASCFEARKALHDYSATIDARYAGSPPEFGPLGRNYREVSERLAAAMKAQRPDVGRIEKLWHEADRLKLELGSRFLTTRSQCTIDRVKLMSPDERVKFLRAVAPKTREELEKTPLAPPAPPPPPRIRP